MAQVAMATAFPIRGSAKVHCALAAQQGLTIDMHGTLSTKAATHTRWLATALRAEVIGFWTRQSAEDCASAGETRPLGWGGILMCW